MRALQAVIRVRMRKKAEVVDRTKQVADAVTRSGVDEGICTVFVRHATAAIVIKRERRSGLSA